MKRCYYCSNASNRKANFGRYTDAEGRKVCKRHLNHPLLSKSSSSFLKSDLLSKEVLHAIFVEFAETLTAEITLRVAGATAVMFSVDSQVDPTVDFDSMSPLDENVVGQLEVIALRHNIEIDINSDVLSVAPDWEDEGKVVLDFGSNKMFHLEVPSPEWLFFSKMRSGAWRVHDRQHCVQLWKQNSWNVDEVLAYVDSKSKPFLKDLHARRVVYLAQQHKLVKKKELRKYPKLSWEQANYANPD